MRVSLPGDFCLKTLDFKAATEGGVKNFGKSARQGTPSEGVRD